MLHIHNGESTAGTLRELGFPGEHKAFQEVLMEGPTPSGLSIEEWVEVRAGFLAAAYELEFEKCAKDLRDQELWLRGFAEHDETILWFEHDLFCQINLICLLDWFSKQTRGKVQLSLICIGEFRGKADFRGLGELTGEQLASLFDERHEVTEGELRLAALAWAAYRSPDPDEISRLLEENTSAMPFLRRALQLHLKRFPSVMNGLGGVENTALELLSKDALGFKSLFTKFAKAQPAYGVGDSQLWCALKRIGGAGDPLITISGIPGSNSNRYYDDASFELTETGRAVLAGDRDFIDTNGIDLWLGGVHLADGQVWRWDENAGVLMRTP